MLDIRDKIASITDQNSHPIGRSGRRKIISKICGHVRNQSNSEKAIRKGLPEESFRYSSEGVMNV
jgi:hypothetical protein